MEPSKPLGKYIVGLKAALRKYRAIQRDQYSWIAKTEKYYIFTAEVDHIEPDRNRYNHKGGIFHKTVPALSTELGDAPLTVSHAKELFDAIKETFNKRSFCQLLLVKGTKYGKTSGGVKAVMDNDLWEVISFSGEVSNGFEFVIERIKTNTIN